MESQDENGTLHVMFKRTQIDKTPVIKFNAFVKSCFHTGMGVAGRNRPIHLFVDQKIHLLNVSQVSFFGCFQLHMLEVLFSHTHTHTRIHYSTVHNCFSEAFKCCCRHIFEANVTHLKSD